MNVSREPVRRATDYGHFLPSEGCYVLTQEPPRKWVNLHYNDIGEHEVYAEISNIGDGPITVRDGAGNTCRLVGYDAKYLYVRDDATNEAFCPGGAPLVTPLDRTETRYYAGFTRTEGEALGLRVRQEVFVPRTEALEAWLVTVTNTSDRARMVSLFGYAMFDLSGNNAEGGPVPRDNHSEVLAEHAAVHVINRHRLCPTNRYQGYLTALRGYVGATGYRDHFLRSDFSVAAPRLLRGWNADNRAAFGPDCVGALQLQVDLAPGESWTTAFLLGQTDGAAGIAAVRQRLNVETLTAMRDEQEQRERQRAKAFTVDTGNAPRDALFNLFAKKQLFGYLLNKSGFRDNLQVDMALAMVDYPVARANLLRALASQFADGNVPHGFRPLNAKQYADKPAWILQVVPAMIKESGEMALLEEIVPYFRSEETGTVWDHMLRTMRYLISDTGVNGLCDQHFADWNDGLEPSEETGERESVMVTQQLCLGLREVEALAHRRGEEAVAREAREAHAEFTHRLNEVAWDGQWYQRTLCGRGYRIGTAANPEAKVFLNTQAWAILSGTAPEERARRCMEAVDTYLEHDVGFSIVDPPFSAFDQRIGKFSAMRPGHATNGGCYNHAAGFKAVADCMLGRAREAWRTLVKVAPDSPWNPVSQSHAEPFSFTNCYERWPSLYGRSQYPWRTGTAAWFSMLLVEWILGARRHYDGLLIDPCLTAEVPRARLVRHFRGAEFRIEIDNTAGRERGVQQLHVNGDATEARVLTAEPGNVYNVAVTI